MINIKSFAKQKDSYIVAQGNSTIKTSSTIAGSDIDKYFYMDDVGNLHTPYVFIGDKQVAALGIGNTTGGTGGSIEIIDNLVSTSTNAALSANQGRVLKALIDSLDGGSGTGTAFENASILAAITQTNIDNWNTAFTNNHTHSNKSVLDNLTQSVIDNSHTHSNKTILDAISSDDITNWGTAYTNNHTHSNKTQLDKVTSTKISHWDTAYTNNHTHSNKTVLDNLTQTVIDNSHTHVNKTVLDGITSTNIENWDKITDYFYLDSDNNLHTGYNLIGDKSVSAYGLGSTSSGGNLSVVDNLTSTSTTSALSANQGRVLKGLIDSIEATGSVFENATVLAGITSDNVSHWNTAFTNNHSHSNKTVIDGITSTKVSNWDTAYGWGDHSAAGYVKSSGVTSITIKNGTGITGGSNTATTTTGTYTIGLTTAIQTDIANGATAYGWGNHASAGYLTSHQDISGKENTSNKVSSWSTTTNNTRYPSEKLVKDSLDGKISTTHAANNVTSTKISNWDTAYTNNHTHSNKSTLDGITSTKVTNWDNVAGYFYLDSDGNLHTSYNLIGDKSVSAYGAGSSSSGGTLSVVDNLTSTSTSSALSANQGRVLKGLIDTLSSQGSVFDNATVLAGITSDNVSHWNTAYTNNHTHSNKTVIDGITSTKVSNWDTAYGWGNHASAGYLKSVSWSQVSSKPTFATVATSGKYSDLSGTPTIPTTLPANGGNADTVDNEHASAFAHVGSHNNLTAAGNEFTFASSAFNGALYINYRTAGGTNGNITDYYFCDGKGGIKWYLSTIASNASNGNTAYSWGNHASAGYIKSVSWSEITGTTPTWNQNTTGTAAGITGYSFKNLSSVGTSGWTKYDTDSKIIPTMSFMAYWNGAYSGTSSNLTYCAQGSIIGSNNIGSQSVSYATSSGRSQYLETQNKDNTNFYGNSYKLYCKWDTNTHVKLKVTDGTYTVGVDDAVSVVDYGNTASRIKIGYSGAGLSSCTYLAAYGTVDGGTVIKDINTANVKVGSATSADAIKALDANDNASSSDTWRKVWISYNNGTTGRPAITDNLAFQTSTNSLKIGSGIIKYDSTNDVFKVNKTIISEGSLIAYGASTTVASDTITLKATSGVTIDTTASQGGTITLGHSTMGMTTQLLGYSVNIGTDSNRPYGTSIYASYSLNINGSNTVTVKGTNTTIEGGGAGLKLNGTGSAGITINSAGALNSNKAITVTSDTRLKNIGEDVHIEFNDVLEMPVFNYSLKDDESNTQMIGSSAQYWKDRLPNAVNENTEGYLGLDYTAVNLASNKALAEKVKEQEEYIETLENRIKMLEEKFAKFEAILS